MLRIKVGVQFVNSLSQRGELDPWRPEPGIFAWPVRGRSSQSLPHHGEQDEKLVRVKIRRKGDGRPIRQVDGVRAVRRRSGGGRGV